MNFPDIPNTSSRTATRGAEPTSYHCFREEHRVPPLLRNNEKRKTTARRKCALLAIPQLVNRRNDENKTTLLSFPSVLIFLMSQNDFQKNAITPWLHNCRAITNASGKRGTLIRSLFHVLIQLPAHTLNQQASGLYPHTQTHTAKVQPMNPGCCSVNHISAASLVSPSFHCHPMCRIIQQFTTISGGSPACSVMNHQC